MPDTNETQTEPQAKESKPNLFVRTWDWLFCWKIARRVLIGLAVLITLIAVIYLVEGIRGKRAWNQFKAEMAEAGETLKPKDLMPPPVPDAENFAMTPLLAPLLDYEYTGSPGKHATDWPEARWNDATRKARLDKFHGLGQFEDRSLTKRHKQRLTDLGSWQSKLRADTNFSLPAEQLSKVIVHQDTGPAVGASAAFDTNFAAREILLALSHYDKEFNELHQAAKRPHAQFPIHVDEGFACLLPHLTLLRKFARVSHLKAVSLLAEKRPDEALQELLLIIRFTESFRHEPVLISGLVHIALNSQISAVVWEGMVRKQWSPEHLAIIEKRLRSTDFVAEYRQAIRGERALGVSTLLKYRDNFEILSQKQGAGVFFRWAPSGIFYQNLVVMGRMYDEYILEPVDFTKKIIHLEKAEESGAHLQETFGEFHIYRVAAALMFPAVTKALQRYAEGQAEIDQVRLACAIEQYRNKHQNIPSILTDLVPEFLPELPHDPVNGDNYVYHTSGDDYVIYSLGADTKDNGGKIEWKEKKPNERIRERGDWVWNSSAAK
ncbi:MAG: hypothetical protein ACPGVU_01920 [Limisphaerales bacterium]